MDLPGSTLGLASSSIIFLDSNAAGHGWFLDPTPHDDSEFTSESANEHPSSQVDLLSVLAHELGHLLGMDDDAAADPYGQNVMADALPVGLRRMPERLVSVTPSRPKPSPVAPVQLSWAAPARDANLEANLDALWGQFDLVEEIFSSEPKRPWHTDLSKRVSRQQAILTRLPAGLQDS